MDIIEDVSSDILTNTLKNLSPEDKVGYFVYTEITVMIEIIQLLHFNFIEFVRFIGKHGSSVVCG